MLRRRYRRQHREHRSSSSVLGCPVNRTLSACLRDLWSDRRRISSCSTTMSEDPVGLLSEVSATHPHSAIQEQPSNASHRDLWAVDQCRHPLSGSVWRTSRLCIHYVQSWCRKADQPVPATPQSGSRPSGTVSDTPCMAHTPHSTR